MPRPSATVVEQAIHVHEGPAGRKLGRGWEATMRRQAASQSPGQE
jgi:hypothetical protein